MWAREIEGDLFAIKNLPFFAFGLNFDDVVRATPGDSGLREVRAVVRRTGHQPCGCSFRRMCCAPINRCTSMR
jgi:hypothetical protein